MYFCLVDFAMMGPIQTRPWVNQWQKTPPHGMRQGYDKFWGLDKHAKNNCLTTNNGTDFLEIRGFEVGEPG